MRWPKQERGKKSSWLHVQFESEGSVAEACQLSGQSMMGRELVVEPATEGGMTDKPLNMGQAVKDCWFCLSNDQVRSLGCMHVYGIIVVACMPVSLCHKFSCKPEYSTHVFLLAVVSISTVALHTSGFDDWF